MTTSLSFIFTLLLKFLTLSLIDSRCLRVPHWTSYGKSRILDPTQNSTNL